MERLTVAGTIRRKSVGGLIAMENKPTREEFEQYKKELNAMLIKGFDGYKSFCRKWGIEYSNNPEVALRAFHKARTAKPGLPLRIRQESKRILDERHSSSFDDGDLQ